MLNIVIIVLLLILFYQHFNKKENFNVLSKYRDIKGEDLELLKKLLHYIKSFENIDFQLKRCSVKYNSYDELYKYNTDILNENRTFVSEKLWIQNNKLNFCQDIIDKEEKDECYKEKYNERLIHGKNVLKDFNNKSEWIKNYNEIYPNINTEKKFKSNEINSNNIFFIYRLHSLLYELSENYKLEDNNIKYNNLSNIKIKPLLSNINVKDLLQILINIDIPSKSESLIKVIIKNNNIKENNIDTSVITNKIIEISKLINGFNIMSCDFISFDETKN